MQHAAAIVQHFARRLDGTTVQYNNFPRRLDLANLLEDVNFTLDGVKGANFDFRDRVAGE